MPHLFSTSHYPLYSAALLSIILIFYLIGRRHVPGVAVFIVLLASAILWSIGSAMEISFRTLAVKYFWHRVFETGAIWVPFIWFFIVLRMRERRTTLQPVFSALLALIPLAFTLLAWTNFQQLYWQDMYTLRYPQIQALTITSGPAGLASDIFNLLISLATLGLIAWDLIVRRSQRFGQAILLSAAILLPLVVHLLFLVGMAGSHEIDPAPYFFNLSLGLFVFGLFRYRLLNIVPVGYQTMIDELPDAVVVLSPDNYVTYANPAAEAILQRSSQALTRRPATQALAAYPALLELSLNPDAGRTHEIVLEQAGQAAYYDLSITPLSDRPSNIPVGQMIRLRNITARVQAEAASRQSQQLLKSSEEKYRQLVENLPDILFTLDIEGKFSFLSPAIEALTGYAAQEMLGKNIRDFIYPEDLALLEENLSRVSASQMRTFEYRIYTRSGAICWMRSYIQATASEGQYSGVQGFIMEITERKQVEEALERRATQLTMLNMIGEQIAGIIELKNVLDLAPRLIRNHFGYYHVAIFTPDYGRGELLMRTNSGEFSELFPEDHHLKFGQGVIGWTANNKQTLLVNDVRLEPRYTNLYPDKIITRAELAVPIVMGEDMLGVLDIQSPLVDAFDDNDVRVMETIADQIAIAMEHARLYEEIRRQVKELEAANASLREMDRLKSQFLANMSHELRTPLNSIIGFSEVLSDELAGPLQVEQKEYLQYIVDSGKHLLRLINDLLDFSKIQSGRIVLDTSTFEIKTFFDELRMTLTPLAEKKAQSLIFRQADSLPPITADHLRLKQVFINLLSNANKFTPPGGLITAACQMDGADELLFSVADTGIGIQPEDQAMIFEEFRQVDGSMTREVEGTGLGLAISKRIVEMHHGQIWVESELGQGATFYVKIPVHLS